MPGQGLWGLVDQRAVRTWEATGRAAARLVAAIREVLDAETHASTGTRFRLIRRVVKTVEATHGPGVVPLPSRNTFYDWLPSSAARAISATVWNSGPQNSHLFFPWGQFAVFAVYTAVLLVVGGILFRKRDA